MNKCNSTMRKLKLDNKSDKHRKYIVSVYVLDKCYTETYDIDPKTIKEAEIRM